MKGTILILMLFLVTIIPYKPQGVVIGSNNKAEKPVVKTEDIVKKADSIQKKVDTRVDVILPPIVDTNSKLKEDNAKLSKIQTQLTNEIIDDLIKERKDLVYKNQALYIPNKSFKSMAVQFKGDVFYIVKDSVCMNYRKPLFSKKICTQYDYFLKITK